jgi:hypothetical protein
MQGSGATHDAFWFDLNEALSGGGVGSFTGTITSNITTPTGGSYPTDGQFAVVRDLGNFGQGWSSGYNYGATVSDSSAGSSLDYYTGHLIFTLTATDGSLLSLASGGTHNGSTVYGGADLRQCPGSDPTSGSCTTGPVGFTLEQTPTQQSGVPEPATWALLLVGFGFVGAAMRRRKPHPAMRLAYA